MGDTWVISEVGTRQFMELVEIRRRDAWAFSQFLDTLTPEQLDDYLVAAVTTVCVYGLGERDDLKGPADG